ncbi:Hypothetical predicted protein, partial [Paramuricea clavata]
QLINPTTGISTQNFPCTTENSRSVNTASNKEDDGTTVAIWHIVVSLVSGIMIGTLLSYIVFCSRRKFRSRKPQSNPEPKTTEADTTYINTEDNYQSFRVNAASYDAGNGAGNGAGNDDDSTYTDLNKTRDVEDLEYYLKRLVATFTGIHYTTGQISLPPGGDTFVVLPGENVSIAWKLNVSITDVLGRWWTFLPKNDYLFADIIRDGNVIEVPQYSPGPFTITKPSTLILKNVTIQYNGTYTFSILAKGKPIAASIVTVFVAGKCH